MWVKLWIISSICLLTLTLQGQVRLNEIMSENETVLADEDGDFSDWIELYNSGNDIINLVGLTLTDDEDDPDQWTFPFTQLAPNGHVIVFCSGKNRLYGPYLHTNFKLKSSGEELILSDGNLQVLDYVRATPLAEDVALARVVDGEGNWERYSDATPGGYNSVQAILSLEPWPNPHPLKLSVHLLS